MGWTYLCLTESTYSPGTEDSASHLASGSDLSLIVKTIDTLKEYFSHGWLSRSYPVHRYGMTSTPSQPRYSKGQMLFMVDSHARTSVMQDLEEAWKESEVDYSTNCVEWSKKLRPNSSSSKTYLQYVLADFELFSENLPIWGMTVDGLVYLPKKLEPRTYVNDGSCWPTPTASERSGTNPNTGKGHTLSKTVRLIEMNMPPNVSIEEYKAKYKERKPGRLNPVWVGWLMGVPLGWSELKPWVMEWYRNKREKHSKD